MDLSMQIHAAKGLLDIRKPVKLIIRTDAPKKQKNLAAYCEPSFRKGKIIGFRIYINLPVTLASSHKSGYTFTDIILHEMAHAAQFQHNIFDNTKHHDKRFIGLCKYLKTEFKKLGVPVGKLYNPLTDTD